MSKGDIHPWVVEGLLYYGLITQEQAEEASRSYRESWNEAWEDTRWWARLADLAWSFRPWYRRWFGLPMTWKYEWIRERRGW